MIMQGCQDAGGKRSLGTQSSAKYSTDNDGATSILYSGGKDERCVYIIHTYIHTYINICIRICMHTYIRTYI